MEETLEIQFKNKHKINRIGQIMTILLLLYIVYFFYSASYERMDFNQIMICLVTILIILVFIVSFVTYRTYEKATFNFIPEGIIIKAKIGFLPIKFKDITSFKSDGIVSLSNGMIEFVIQIDNSKEYRIRSKPEIYEALINLFPDKNGKFLI